MNLLKCDNCGNRNILCFNCESNEHYRNTAFSHDEYVKRKAIEGYVEEVVKDLEEASFVVEVDYDFDEEDDGNVECVFLSEAINIVRKGVLKSCTNSLKKIGGDD